MPYKTKWEPNELFVEHHGMRIFHTYRNNDGEAHTYWYGTASNTRDSDDDTKFDVRNLPTWEYHTYSLQIEQGKENNSFENAIRDTIIAAIDYGDLDNHIQAAEDRPKELPDATIKANCFVKLSFERESWNIEVNCVFGDAKVCIPITEEQKAELEKAGLRG